MRLLIKKDDSGKYYYKKEAINLKSIANYIREGNDIEVVNEHDIDITKETLFSIAFISKRTIAEMTDGMCFLLSYDKLYNIIEEGGIDDYMSRIRKGFKSVK
jgi:hypothetical protein